MIKPRDPTWGHARINASWTCLRRVGLTVECYQRTRGGAGSPWHIGGCGPVTVGGNFQFQSNGGTGNSISMTTVQGNLQCQSNHDVSGTGNTVAGIRQCPGVA